MKTLSKMSPPISRQCRLLRLALVLLGACAMLPAQGIYAQNDSDSNTVSEEVDGAFITREFDFTGSATPADYIITDVNFSLTFAKVPEAPGENPFYDEMSFTLTNPSGTRISILIDFDSFDIGDVDMSFDGTIVFDDAAADPVNVDNNQPQEGTFRPISPLDIFNGTTFGAGVWTLTIDDRAPGAPLTFRSGTLTITSVVPEPATSATLLLGATLLGGAALWRRRRAQRLSSKI